MDYIDECNVWDITIIGGESVVSSDVFEDLLDATDGGWVERLSGADRYETALAVSEWEYGWGPCYMILATGENFPGCACGGTACR